MSNQTFFDKHEVSLKILFSGVFMVLISLCLSILESAFYGKQMERDLVMYIMAFAIFSVAGILTIKYAIETSFKPLINKVVVISGFISGLLFTLHWYFVGTLGVVDIAWLFVTNLVSYKITSVLTNNAD